MYSVFNLERALGELDAAGGRVGRADDWMARGAGDGGGDTARYPPWCQTWKYLPESVFWADPEYVGLSEQYLPHVDTSQDFLRRLVRGDTPSELVRAIGATRPERAREREEDRAFTPEELYIRQGPRAERRRVGVRSASVNYDTTNPLVHAAADASQVYERLRQIYPPHYPATIVAVQRRVAEVGACVNASAAGAWRAPGEAIPLEGGPPAAREWRPRALDQLSQGERAQWESFMTRVTECETYNAIVREAQRVLLGTYEGLLPLAGDIEGTSLSDPLKAILCWYRDCHEERLPHVTRAFVWKDEAMDPFGLTQLGELGVCGVYRSSRALTREEHAGILVKFARILQPMVCMLCEGLFSCYDHFLDELSFHLILHGIHDTGKSFTGIYTLIKYICIPDTVSEVSQSSKRAGTSRRHVYDLINASDECPVWITDEKKGSEHHREEIDEAKLRFTRGQVTRQCLEFVEPYPGAPKVRWTTTTTCDFKAAVIYITNDAKNSKAAISSRMCRVTMKPSSLPVYATRGAEIASTLRNDGQMWLFLNQFLTAMSKKAAAVGAILPDVEFSVFDRISGRVLDYLRANTRVNVEGGRSLDIMRTFLRQLVYKMAIRYAFDMPFSPSYKKKFRHSMIQEIQPYLYATTFQVWWVWTACGGEYVDTDNSNVIRAMCRACGIEDLVRGYSPYEQFAYDVDNLIPFRTMPNPNHAGFGGIGNVRAMSGVARGAPAGGPDAPAMSASREREERDNAFLVDLAHAGLEAHSLDELATKVAPHTNPLMSVSSVKAHLHAMCELTVTPEGGRITPQPRGSMMAWHRFQRNPTAEHPESGVKRLSTAAHPCPPAYTRTRDTADYEYRTVEDLERTQQTVHIIDVTNMKDRGVVWFMPCAADMFCQSLIIQALIHATMCASTQPGKYLLGLPLERDTRYMQVKEVPRDMIDRYVDSSDSKAGFRRGRDGQLVYQGPEPLDRAPTPRAHGLGFTNVMAIPESEARHMSREPLAPRPVGSQAWRVEYAAAFEMMGNRRFVVQDLDEDAALRQHMRCGLPLDAPVRTPRWIRAEYERHCREVEKCEPYMGVNYPRDVLREQDRGAATRAVTSSIDTASVLAMYAEMEAAEQQQQHPEGVPAPVVGVPAARRQAAPPPARQGQKRAQRVQQAAETGARDATVSLSRQRQRQLQQRDDANTGAMKKLRAARAGGRAAADEN